MKRVTILKLRMTTGPLAQPPLPKAVCRRNWFRMASLGLQALRKEAVADDAVRARRGGEQGENLIVPAIPAIPAEFFVRFLAFRSREDLFRLARVCRSVRKTPDPGRPTGLHSTGFPRWQ
jgi:hypothetical protein